MPNHKAEKHIEVDVLIVSRERCQSLYKCCEAVLNNSVLPKKLIIVQANDSQEARQIKKDIVKLAKKVNVDLIFKNVVDRGISYSRNIAIENTSSPYFAFIDDDELVPSNWLETAIKILSKNPQLIAINGPKVPSQIDRYYWHWVFYKLIVEPTLSRERVVKFVTSGNSFFKTAFVKNQQISFDNSFVRASEDEVFSFKLRRAGAQFRFFPQLVVKHVTKTSFKEICRQFFCYGEMGLRFHHSYLDPHSNKIKRLIKCLFFIKAYQIGSWTKNENKLNFGYLSINLAYRLGRLWGLIKYF